MQREIKFRAWANYSKEMFYPDTDEGGWELRNGTLNPLPNTTLMQFTGLKDKNGKEIYEGDVVKDVQIVNPYVVEWYESGFNIESGGLEVIGNIFEQPDLLKGKE